MLDQFGSNPFESRDSMLEVMTLLREQERRRCETDFGFFAKQAWHTIEPTVPYVHGAHIEAIVDHLDACLPRVQMVEEFDPFTGGIRKVRKVFPGQIRKLLITMPPRHAKSTLVSVLWPSYVWTRHPEFRWLFSSYAQALSIRDTMRMRAVVMSPWYQGLWASSFRLLADQNEKSKFYNTSMGYRISASVASGVTGEGGDGVIVDDAHNVHDADSEKMRQNTIDWWFEAMSTRLNNPDTGFHVVCMQRVHQKDLPAMCVERGYVHLNLPARYDSTRACVTVLGWKDWRSTDGQLLWPERFNEKAMVSLEKDLGSFGTDSQLQQNPKPRGGTFIRRNWFTTVDSEFMKTVSGTITWFRAWDLALKADGDRVTSVEVGCDADGFTYLRRGVSWRKDWPHSCAQILAIGAHEKNRVIVEAIGTTKSAGEEVADSLRGTCLVDLIVDKRNKVSEAIPWIAHAEAGKFRFVDETESEWPFFSYNSTPWIEHFLGVLTSWVPDASLSQADDEIDSISMGHAKAKTFIPLIDRDYEPISISSRYGDIGGYS